MTEFNCQLGQQVIHLKNDVKTKNKDTIQRNFMFQNKYVMGRKKNIYTKDSSKKNSDDNLGIKE